MSYLSRIQLGKAEAAKLLLRDSYAWHRRLWLTFPGQEGQRRSFLFRIDDRHDAFRVLLLSPGPPAPQAWGAWQVAEVKPDFLRHERYLFQVRANPTVKRVVHEGGGAFKRNGRRTGIYDREGLRSWMGRKAAQSGFALLECDPGPPMHGSFVKDGRGGKHTGVDFRGALRVTDSAAFERAFHTGIGPAKAFGFGLLMLQPVA